MEGWSKPQSPRQKNCGSFRVEDLERIWTSDQEDKNVGSLSGMASHCASARTNTAVSTGHSCPVQIIIGSRTSPIATDNPSRHAVDIEMACLAVSEAAAPSHAFSVASDL